jgi:hypothetical protein
MGVYAFSTGVYALASWFVKSPITRVFPYGPGAAARKRDFMLEKSEWWREFWR